MDLRAVFAIVVLAAANGAAAQAPLSAGEKARRESEALYMKMHAVLTHPRCMNCHPVGNSPRQGDTRTLHQPPITRGPKDEGPPGLSCAACHQRENYSVSGVPGAPNWHLAPRSQGWEGLSPGQLCHSITNRRTNGGKTLDEVVKHLVEDELVAWGWNPGIDVNGRAREPVPIAKTEFNRIVEEWAKLGAACPR